MEQMAPSVFFSNELCAHYFTYMNRDSGAHFVLFDDVGSIQKKLSLAEEMGIRRFFLFYHQMDDLLPDILGVDRP
jgi:spore germination protein YaaH